MIETKRRSKKRKKKSISACVCAVAFVGMQNLQSVRQKLAFGILIVNVSVRFLFFFFLLYEKGAGLDDELMCSASRGAGYLNEFLAVFFFFLFV